MVGSFLGVLMLGYNGMLRMADKDEDTHTFGEARWGSYTAGAFMALGVSIMFSSVTVIVRMLQKIHFSINLFYYNMCGSVMFALTNISWYFVNGEFTLFSYEWKVLLAI